MEHHALKTSSAANGRPADPGPPARIASLEHLAEQAKAEAPREAKDSGHGRKDVDRPLKETVAPSWRGHAKDEVREKDVAAKGSAPPFRATLVPAAVAEAAPGLTVEAPTATAPVIVAKPPPAPVPAAAKAAVLPAVPPAPAAPPVEPAPSTAVGPVGAPADARRRSPLLDLLFRFAPVLGWKRVHARNAARHEGRAALLAHLRARPGDHLRSLARALGMTPQNAAYHLRQLRSCGLAASVDHEGKVRWFPAEGGRPLQERALAETFLAGAGRAAILAAIVAAPGIHQGEIARRVGAEPGTVNWSLRRLVEQGFLQARAEGNRTCYVPTERATALPGPALAPDLPPAGPDGPPAAPFPTSA